MRIGVIASVLGCASLVAACDVSPARPSAASWFSATVTGSTIEGQIPSPYTYSGTGTFTTTSARRPAAPPLFLLRSEGAGAAQNDGFELSRSGDTVPGVGSYDLGAGGAGALQMTFTQRRGAVTYRYAAEAGTLQITSASRDRLAGTFDFRGVFAGTCSGTAASVQCSVEPPRADAPRIAVTGSFDAVAER